MKVKSEQLHIQFVFKFQSSIALLITWQSTSVSQTAVKYLTIFSLNPPISHLLSDTLKSIN